LLGHWWILIVLAAGLILLFWAPRMLPKLGSRLGRGAHELKDASVEAGKNLRREATGSADPKADPPNDP
jgi:Sec-independent protein translocase protein TatA